MSYSINIREGRGYIMMEKLIGWTLLQGDSIWRHWFSLEETWYPRKVQSKLQFQSQVGEIKKDG